MSDDYLLLKWGTLKGWSVSPGSQAKSFLEKYGELGMSPSAMTQHDTPEQKKALCDAIRSIDGEVRNDWSGEIMDKDSAVAYVMNYGQKPANNPSKGEK